MSTLKQQLSEKKWGLTTLDKGGKLKLHHRYGENRRLPLQDDLVILYVRGAGIHKCSASYLEDLACALGDMAADCDKHVRVYVWPPTSEKWRPLNDKVQLLPHDHISRLETLAQAGTIVAVGYLPPYFIRRDGQRVIHVWAEPDDLNDGHRCCALGYNAQLLNSTHIVAEDQPQVDLALQDYRMRGIYSGELLRWNGSSTYGESIARLAVQDSANEFTRVGCDTDKKRVLLLSREKDVPEYRELTQSIVDRYDRSKIDLTLLLLDHNKDSHTLESLPKETRVICRVSTFSLPPDEFSVTLAALEQAGDYDSYGGWRHHLHDQALLDEARRMVGTSTFDTLIYCAEPNALAFCLADALDCTHKVRLILSQQTGEGRTTITRSRLAKAFDHSACQDIFDVAYVDSPAMRQLLEAEAWASCELDSLSPVPAIHRKGDRYCDDAVYEGRPYALAIHAQSDYKTRCALLPLPTDNAKSYLLDASECNPARMVSAIAEKAGENWECIIIGTMDKSIVDSVVEAFPQHVLSAGDLSRMALEHEALEQYVGRFDAYVTTSPQMRNVVWVAAARQQLQMLQLDSGTLTAIEVKEPPTYADLEASMSAEVSRIIG